MGIKSNFANAGALILALVAVFDAGCAAGGPETRLIGCRVADLAARLGVQCAEWHESDVPGYEVACDPDREVALFGLSGTLAVIRRGDKVAALDFTVRKCTGARYEDLRRKVIEDYGIEENADRDVYAVLRAGVVHLKPEDDGSARLVLTDEAYGRIYVEQVLKEGLSNLSNGLRPH